MIERTVIVSAPLGLHARASARIVHVASRFKSNLTLERKDGKAVADAKSIISVLMLAASCGTQLRIVANGVDEDQAIKEMDELFTAEFTKASES